MLVETLRRYSRDNGIETRGSWDNRNVPFFQFFFNQYKYLMGNIYFNF